MKHKILTKKYLIQQYYELKLSTYQIAKNLNIPQCTVYWYLDKYKIKGRTLSQSHIGKKLSKEHIKNMSGKNNGHFKDGRALKKYYCKICGKEITYQGALYGSGLCRSCASRKSSLGRKQSKETIEKRMKHIRGKNHWCWKGGISSLTHIIRNLPEYREWRQKVFGRDWFECQDCGYKGKNIEAHHKKVFEILFAEFLKEYDQFSPIEDRETLIRLATKWKPFWDVDNGQTLCAKCHDKIKRVKTK